MNYKSFEFPLLKLLKILNHSNKEEKKEVLKKLQGISSIFFVNSNRVLKICVRAFNSCTIKIYSPWKLSKLGN